MYRNKIIIIVFKLIILKNYFLMVHKHNRISMKYYEGLLEKIFFIITLFCLSKTVSY